MCVLELNRIEFHALASQIISGGHRLRFQASGDSMQPFILNKDILEVAPLAGNQIKWGDVLLVEIGEERLVVHRVVKIGRRDGISNYLIKGDTCTSPDGWFPIDKFLGRVEVLERGSQRIRLNSGALQGRVHLWIMIIPWVSKISWQLKRFNQLIRKWLLVS